MERWVGKPRARCGEGKWDQTPRGQCGHQVSTEWEVPSPPPPPQGCLHPNSRNLSLYRAKDVIKKSHEWRNLSWIIWVGPKCTCPFSYQEGRVF